LAFTVAGALVQMIGMATSFIETQARGEYYDPQWHYRLSYSLGSQVELLFHYLGSAAPAPLGLGFDRWFVFLAKVSVSHVTLLALGALMLCGLAAAALRLRSYLRAA
jgi:hypothetical protein